MGNEQAAGTGLFRHGRLRPRPPRTLQIGVLVATFGLACAPEAAHRTPRLPPGDGATATGSVTGDGGAGPGAACGDAQPWIASRSYAEGDHVTAGSPPHVYQCKPWPYSGWCAIAAYQPGKDGGPWPDAWMDLGLCP